jgi:hypothetical protein
MNDLRASRPRNQRRSSGISKEIQDLPIVNIPTLHSIENKIPVAALFGKDAYVSETREGKAKG